MAVSYDDNETKLMAYALLLLDALQNGKSATIEIESEKLEAFIENNFGLDQINAAVDMGRAFK